MYFKKIYPVTVVLPGIMGLSISAQALETKSTDNASLEAVEVVSEETGLFPQTAKATPSYEIETKEVEKFVNATTVEDYLRYAPSINIRKRYIGDPNGSLGMRGSNVFQTAHTMVFADGMPLHNPLRTTFNGAPRWSMVSPNEVATADVLYGPFSAQYDGHSFGGVVNLNTNMPEKFEAHMDAMGMFQTMDRGGRKQTLEGYKTNISAGDRFDKFSIFGSYNRLDNQGQPMTPRTTAIRGTGGRVVNGPIFQNQPNGSPGVYLGDDGIARTVTDLYKVKMGYDFTPDLQGRFTVGYEERTGETNDPLSLIKDSSGNTLWGGATANGNTTNTTYRMDGKSFSVPGSTFSVSESERQAINLGLGLKGKISDDWSIDTNASYYDAFNDTTVTSALNPNHPLNQNKGQVTDIDAWWANYDIKLATDNFLDNKDLSFMGGYQFNHASLNSKVFNSNNYLGGSKDSLSNDSGGDTQTNSVFSQLEWRFLPDWAIMAGARVDNWQTIDGHVYNYSLAPALREQDYNDRDATRISPKASLEYSPDVWTFRYSFSKAYRFPIAEEMFLSNSTFNSSTVSYPGLGPENGYFHNFMVQYDIPRGFVRADFFYDLINDEIANTLQNFGNVAVTTFQPIEQTETIGVDLTFQQNEVFGLPVDFMVNGTFMNKQIVKNSRNSDLAGNEWDRIPKLQVNTSATYHILPVWDFSAAVRYRSDVFQRLDNSDTEANVFGGTDEYTFVDLKTSYQLPEYHNLKSTISAGIDNVLNVDVYENHPFPQRTYFVKASLDY